MHKPALSRCPLSLLTGSNLRERCLYCRILHQLLGLGVLPLIVLGMILCLLILMLEPAIREVCDLLIAETNFQFCHSHVCISLSFCN
jgi:hypothetical protein